VERPSAARRTKQILDAAEGCFRRYGFHSTSMARLAGAAEMSVGHIYRYFPSKNDIIKAIVERDVAVAMADFDFIETNTTGVSAGLMLAWRRKLEQLSDPCRSGLWLEILAEAHRNPTVADVLGCAQTRIRSRLEALLSVHADPSLSSEDIMAKVDLLLMLTDAIAFGLVGNPKTTRSRLIEQAVTCGGVILSALTVAHQPSSDRPPAEDVATRCRTN
jgi:AcrR family transcriptional regulator